MVPWLAPWQAWLDVAVRSTELWFNSAQVISSRTGWMMTTAPSTIASHPELTRMWQEKLVAGAQSQWAMFAEMAKIQQQLGWGWLRMASSGPRLALPGAMAHEAIAGAARLSAAAAGITRKGMAPVHRKARANARRLRRIR